MIEEHALLSPEECADVRAGLHALRERWISRHDWVPFYTLGAASYLDAVRNADAYETRAAEHNGLLGERFGWLHERVAAVLSKALDAPVACHERFARPGFHIYLYSAAFAVPTASIHRDLQYESLRWRASESPDLTNPVSFTLAVTLPRAGGGLNVWDIATPDLGGLTPEEIRALIRSCPPRLHAYRTGTLILHSGHMVHQIAPMPGMQEDDERLTLQGHGIRCGDTWQLYW
jgi:hypothetical protein